MNLKEFPAKGKDLWAETEVFILKQSQSCLWNWNCLVIFIHTDHLPYDVLDVSIQNLTDVSACPKHTLQTVFLPTLLQVS